MADSSPAELAESMNGLVSLTSSERNGPSTSVLTASPAVFLGEQEVENPDRLKKDVSTYIQKLSSNHEKQCNRSRQNIH